MEIAKTAAANYVLVLFHSKWRAYHNNTHNYTNSNKLRIVCIAINCDIHGQPPTQKVGPGRLKPWRTNFAHPDAFGFPTPQHRTLTHFGWTKRVKYRPLKTPDKVLMKGKWLSNGWADNSLKVQNATPNTSALHEFSLFFFIFFQSNQSHKLKTSPRSWFFFSINNSQTLQHTIKFITFQDILLNKYTPISHPNSVREISEMSNSTRFITSQSPWKAKEAQRANSKSATGIPKGVTPVTTEEAFLCRLAARWKMVDVVNYVCIAQLPEHPHQIEAILQYLHSYGYPLDFG